MAARAGAPELDNQPPPFADVDLFSTARPLQDAVVANGAGHEAAALAVFGQRWGAAAMFDRGRLANAAPPVLRGDVVEFHPAYHAFMAESLATGLAASTWTADRARVLPAARGQPSAPAGLIPPMPMR